MSNIEKLNDPVPSRALLNGNDLIRRVQPVREVPSDEARIQSGWLAPKEIALSMLLGIDGLIPRHTKSTKFRTDESLTQGITNIIDRDVYPYSLAIRAVRSGTSEITDRLLVSNAFCHLALHPYRDDVFDVPKTISDLSGVECLPEDLVGYAAPFARIAIPSAPKLSRVLDIAEPRQMDALADAQDEQRTLQKGFTQSHI